MFPTPIQYLYAILYKPLQKLNYPGPLSWCSNSTHDCALEEWQKCDTLSGTTLGTASRGDTQIWNAGDGVFCPSWRRTIPQKGNSEALAQRPSPNTIGAPQSTPETPVEVGCWLLMAESLLPEGLGLLQHPTAAPAAATHSLRDPRRRSWSIVPSPSPFTAKKPFSQSLQPFSPQSLNSGGYRRGGGGGRKKRGGGKRERGRERKNNVQSALH